MAFCAAPAYAASDAFNPKQSLTPDQLRAVIDAPLFSVAGHIGVAGFIVVAGFHARKSSAGLRARPIGHWQHWNWQHSHIGNILPTP